MRTYVYIGVGSHSYGGWGVQTQNHWYSSSLSLKALRSRRADGVSLSLKARENQYPSSKAVGQREKICSHSSFYSVQTLSGLVRPTHTGEKNLLTQSANANVNLIWKHPQRHTQKQRFHNRQGHPVAHASWHINILQIPCSSYPLSRTSFMNQTPFLWLLKGMNTFVRLKWMV